MPNNKPEKFIVKPPFRADNPTWSLFCELVSDLAEIDPSQSDSDQRVYAMRRAADATKVASAHRTRFKVAFAVLADVRLQGWEIDVNRDCIEVRRPEASIDPELERMRVRRMHAVNRNVQLIRGSVRSFVRDLETSRMVLGHWVSIFSLMRDGREFADKMSGLTRLSSAELTSRAILDVITPYIQIVEPGERCQHTNIPLTDIWRYFRHTWSSEYQTVPGRNIMILIRDASTAYHPVIGIAALTSPVVHLEIRDRWIGWSSNQFIEFLQSNADASWARWVLDELDQSINEIYHKDLISDGIIAKSSLVKPSEAALASLEEEGRKARARHQLNPAKDLHKTPTKDISDREWLIRAKSDLFRSKRCVALHELLRARMRLQQAGFTKPAKAGLEAALRTSQGRLAIDVVRKRVKAVNVGNNMLDISVCGAISPYSEILGGKLVAMLLTSPEIVAAYGRKYGRANSIIASSMAGRRVQRKSKLAALTTTSLYGAEPNQYTRVRVETGSSDGKVKTVHYRRLGRTRGQGSYHFSSATVDAIEVLLSQSSDSRSVNSIFGEGVNPRLRKIRNGLDACGFPTDDILTHGSPRIVYGISLVENLRDTLLGKERKRRYVFDQRNPKEVTEEIVAHWCQRWFLPRLQKPGLLEAVRGHTLVKPVVHGARVTLPRLLEEELLFADVSDES